MKIKKNYIYAGIALIVLIVIASFYFYTVKKGQAFNGQDVAWLVYKDGTLYYPSSRGEIKFRRDNYSQTSELSVSKVVYQSNGANIYGLLVLPKKISGQLPGVVLLPGAGVSKESELGIAMKISGLGAAVLTIDQRGVGETGGYFPDLDQDYASFVNSKEPYQHLVIYDALRAYDLLYSAPFVDPDRIIMAGESLGGRIAIITTAIDSHIHGVLVISSAGIHFTKGNDPVKDTFIKSIDADHYIASISPRRLVMIHNINDKNIPIQSAVQTYLKANEPKGIFLVNDTACNHGYCDSMYPALVQGLASLDAVKVNGTVGVK